MGLPAPGAFEDLGPFVLCDHALELGEQGILGAVTAGALEEYHGRARLRELLDQQRLVGVLTGQPVRGVDQQHIDWDLADQVTEPFQCRPDQTRPGLAVVFEHPLCGHVQT
jgi:hypothetical protein